MLGMILWAIVLVLIGVLAFTFAVVGVCLLVPIVWFGRSASATAPATVIGDQVEESCDGHYHYPIIEFTVEGKPYRFKGRFGTHCHPRPHVGTVTKVHFPPDRPEAAQLGRFEGLSIALPMILAGVSIGIAVVVELLRIRLVS